MSTLTQSERQALNDIFTAIKQSAPQSRLIFEYADTTMPKLLSNIKIVEKKDPTPKEEKIAINFYPKIKRNDVAGQSQALVKTVPNQNAEDILTAIIFSPFLFKYSCGIKYCLNAL